MHHRDRTITPTTRKAMTGMENLLEDAINTRAWASTSTNWTCDVCGQPKQTTIQLFGRPRHVRCNCHCEQAQREEEKAEAERQRKQRALEKLQKYSLMDKKFYGSTLAAWDEDMGSVKLKKTIRKYVDHWPEMKTNNVGLLIHGSPGIGKTYAAFAIANEIMATHRALVVAVNTMGLLARIRETFNRQDREAEIDIIRSLEKASLLILDDLGAEQKTDWSSTMLYQIIDARYRSGMPLVVTTNLTLDQLQEKLTSHDKVDRTYDRLAEICLPIEVTGASNRARVARSKRQQLIDTLRK